MKNILHSDRSMGTALTAALRTLSRLRWLLLVLISLTCLAHEAMSQTVSHPVAEITESAKHYSYTHMLSATLKKDLEYIIVKASNGDVKTVFNACDVCYPAHKGYSQSGTDLRCNNCGNRFAIDGLGGSNTAGTCNPGYLPHTLQGDQIVINVSDLLVGEYFFLTQTVTGVVENEDRPAVLLMTQDRQNLTLTLPNEGRRTFYIYTLNGQLRRTFINSSRIVHVAISDVTPGAYMLVMEESKMVTTKMFLVY